MQVWMDPQEQHGISEPTRVVCDASSVLGQSTNEASKSFSKFSPLAKPALDSLDLDRKCGDLIHKMGLGEKKNRIGQYELIRELGVGAMGVVYLARDHTLERQVAIKRLQNRRNQDLVDEAKALAQLSHPNVVPIYEIREHGDVTFIVMEYVDGATLNQWLRQGSRTMKEILTVFMAAGAGLVAAHARRIIHRDFKPANVMIGVDGRVRVMDFGLACADPGQEATLTGAVARGSAGMAIAGTPAYMAPEQFRGRWADARSDQFSFCVALYEALHGERPFRGTREQIWMAAERGEIGPAPTHTNVPKWLQQIVVRGLSPEPRERFESMQALLDALGGPRIGVRSRAPVAIRPRRRASTYKVAVGLFFAFGFSTVVYPQIVESLVPPREVREGIAASVVEPAPVQKPSQAENGSESIESNTPNDPSVPTPSPHESNHVGPKARPPQPKPTRVVDPKPSPSKPKPTRVVDPKPSPSQPKPTRVVDPKPPPSQPKLANGLGWVRVDNIRPGSPGPAKASLQSYELVDEGDQMGSWKYGPSDEIVQVGDFDDDGSSDFVIKNSWGLGVVKRNATGGFTTLAAARWGTAITRTYSLAYGDTILAVGDFDSKPKDDLLIKSKTGLVLLDVSATSKSTGSFHVLSHVTWSTSATGWPHVTDRFDGFGDFDGDGVHDFLERDGTRLAIARINLVDGQPAVTTSATAVADDWFESWHWTGIEQILGVGDFDGDGLQDFLAKSDWGIGTLERNGTSFMRLNMAQFGTNWDAWGTNGTDSLIGIADVNGDGRDDIIWESTWGLGINSRDSAGAAVTLASYPDGTWIGGLWHYGARKGAFPAIADFNGDGRADLVIRSLWGVGLLHGQAAGTLGWTNAYLAYNLMGHWQVKPDDVFLPPGDFDGNGRADLFLQR